MTENKRLIVDEDYNIVDTETCEWLDNNQVFDLANKLAEENKKLKKEIKLGKRYCKDIEVDLSNCADERIRLQEENEQLKQVLRELKEIKNLDVILND